MKYEIFQNEAISGERVIDTFEQTVDYGYKKVIELQERVRTLEEGELVWRIKAASGASEGHYIHYGPFLTRKEALDAITAERRLEGCIDD